jgi:hypothetical protein
MARFAIEMNRTASLTLPVGSVGVGSTTRFDIYDIVMGSEATPQDSIFKWSMFACSAMGTSTGVTPKALDINNINAAAILGGENHTIDATPVGGSVLAVALNQRATFRWVAAPGGELISASTASSGFALYTPTASALIAVTATVHANQY